MGAVIALALIVGLILYGSKKSKAAARSRSPGGWVYDVRDMTADVWSNKGLPRYRIRRTPVAGNDGAGWFFARVTDDALAWEPMEDAERAFVEELYTRYNG